MNIISPSFRQEVVEGQNKTLYTTDQQGVFLLCFKEENNDIAYIRKMMSDTLFSLLTDCGVLNHFISSNGVQEQKVMALEMLPFIFSVYAFANEQLAQKFYLSNGMKLKKYLTEIKFKDKNKLDISVSKEHVLSFGWMEELHWSKLMQTVEKVMNIVYAFFKAIGVSVLSLDLEFGKHYKNNGKEFECFLADEMSLKNIHLKIHDYLNYSVEDAYYELAMRLSIIKGK